MYVLGIDAGGSKCAARLVDAQGTVLGHGVSGCANMRLGAPAVFVALRAAWEAALKGAGLGPDVLGQIRAGAGIAGIGRAGARELLEAQDFPFAHIRFASDAEIALMGAHGGQDGGIVIVGTGSVGIGKVSGREIQVGGYGFPVSDEGSGAWMGLQAIRRTLRAADGRIAGSALTKTLLSRFAGDVRKIISWMDRASATDYAALAPLITEHAGQGDAVACDILRAAGAHISTMINSLSGSGVTRLCLCGGLAETLKDWLEPKARARLTRPKGDALDGALLLARLS